LIPPGAGRLRAVPADSRTMDKRLHFSWPPILCLLMGMAAGVCARFALVLPRAYLVWCDRHPAIARVFAEEGVDLLIRFTAGVAGLSAAALAGMAFVALFVRSATTLGLFRKACLLFYATAWMCGVVAVRATHLLIARELSLGGADGEPFNAYTIFLLRWRLLWPVIAVSLGVAYLYILAWRRAAIDDWLGGGGPSEPATGDRFLENLRTHGRDPRFRKSVWSSVGVHLFVVLILPWLLTLDGCTRINPYGAPKGSGTPTVTAPKIVKVKKKKKRILVNPNSAILFNIPTLDDSKISEEVDQESRVTYAADPNRVGAMGAGGGTTGGWPDGVDDAVVRFIRLKYDGSGWDDGMDAVSRADMNFLDMFRKVTKFRTASQSESHPIAALAKYPKGFAPPFVYMTGDYDIRVADSDVKILREYLMGGGMLFADCGSPRWNHSFRSFIRRVFPGESLLTISDDDVIFQIPYTFANGAPPLWHHGGYDAMGIKYKGRWAVFYHPGDVNDAWKNDRGGLEPKKAEGAMELGINIIYYSFSNYLELTRKHRK